MDWSFDFGVRAVWSVREGTGLDFGDRVASALDFLPFHREYRAEVFRLRLGIDAAGGGLLHCIPRGRARAALGVAHPDPAVDVVSYRDGGGPDQAAPRPLLARPDLP